MATGVSLRLKKLKLMRKFLAIMAFAVLMVSCFKEYDDGALIDRMDDFEDRLEKLERMCNEMNSNLDAIQALVEALQNQDYITDVTPLVENGRIIGYTIKFAKGNPIVIYNGENGKDGANGADGKDGVDGADGKDGETPILGVKADDDGRYYWTLNGEWLLDEAGNKLPVTGEDGKDGADGADGKDGENGTDGENGADGTDGKDGITPQLKIENGYWYVSTDNGATWTELGKATGEDGKDGADSTTGIQITQDENNVYFTLADGTVITIPKAPSYPENPDEGGQNPDAPENPDEGEDTPTAPDPDANITFADANAKSLCVANWDTNADGELSYGEAAAVTTLGEVFKNNSDILVFDELQYFTGLTTINEGAFYHCKKLTSAILPQSVTAIGKNAFSNCDLLRQLALPAGLSSIGEEAFYSSGIRSIVIPGGVNTISGSAFRQCLELQNIELNEGVIYIDIYAFRGCNKLQTVKLPKSLLSIESHAFYGCKTLQTITLPENVAFIGYEAFDECETLASVYCKAEKYPSIGTTPYSSNRVFIHNENLKIYVPATSVDDYKTANLWKDYADKIVAYDFEKGEVVGDADAETPAE